MSEDKLNIFKLPKKPVSRESVRLSFYEQILLVGILKGLVVTWKHFFYNLIGHTLKLFGKPFPSESFVVKYPEEPFPHHARLRSRHRLIKREDDSEKCVACFMCATACPTNCIYIEGEDCPDPQIEKHPRVFEIDLLRCCFCGLCVEACPEDAIAMDTGIVELAASSREDFILTKSELLR